MAAKIIEIADQLIIELNANPFSIAFVSARSFNPIFSPEEMGTLRVSVIPTGARVELLSRNKSSEDFQVSVAVQKRVADLSAAVEPLLALIEEIDLFVRFRRLGGTVNAVWVGTEINPLIDPNQLNQEHVFISVLDFTFRVYR